MKMSPELFAKYAKDPLGTDEEVRRILKFRLTSITPLL